MGQTAQSLTCSIMEKQHNQMGREALEGLSVSQKPTASRKINKRIISHPVTGLDECHRILLLCFRARNSVARGLRREDGRRKKTWGWLRLQLGTENARSSTGSSTHTASASSDSSAAWFRAQNRIYINCLTKKFCRKSVKNIELLKLQAKTSNQRNWLAQFTRTSSTAS